MLYIYIYINVFCINTWHSSIAMYTKGKHLIALWVSAEAIASTLVISILGECIVISLFNSQGGVCVRDTYIIPSSSSFLSTWASMLTRGDMKSPIPEKILIYVYILYILLNNTLYSNLFKYIPIIYITYYH